MSDEYPVTQVIENEARPAVVASPFGAPPAPQEREANVEIAAAGVVAEVQAHILMAHRVPRDERRAMDRIIQACTRPTLAQTALYSFSRGGNEITGPSIRLAEVLSQHWGNLRVGWREVERRPAEKDPVTGRIRPGRSTVSTYCVDMESNLIDERSFQVIHERTTKSGSYRLTDERDIYEMIANQAARRVRACILAVIPGDVIETAVEQCETTMLAKADTSPEAVGKLVEAFGKFGVTKEQIEVRIQRRIDTIRPAQIVQLRKVWKSLDDGMSVPGDWFEPTKPPEGAAAPQEPEVKGNEGLKAKMRPQRSTAPSAEPPRTTSDSATPASPASPAPDASGPPTPSEPSRAGENELPLPEAMELQTRPEREPGEEG